MAAVKSYADDACEARKEWSKKSGYYVADFNSGLCMRCVHFSINHDHIEMGTCAKIKQALENQEFAKMGVSDYGVSTIGVCENYMDSFGIGLDDKVLNPDMLPTWIKTRKDKSGTVFVVQETEKQELARYAKEDAAIKKGKSPAA
ncbi:hypothetical protein FACS1894130_07660 [Spirochaetia bacterium]|nr:hypothetical protein FACS1894130_07660 [Spirochaetia bacterium]